MSPILCDNPFSSFFGRAKKRGRSVTSRQAQAGLDEPASTIANILMKFFVELDKNGAQGAARHQQKPVLVSTLGSQGDRLKLVGPAWSSFFEHRTSQWTAKGTPKPQIH